MKYRGFVVFLLLVSPLFSTDVSATELEVMTWVFVDDDLLDVVAIHEATTEEISLLDFFRYFYIDGWLYKNAIITINICREFSRITSDPSYRSFITAPIKFFATCEEATGTYHGISQGTVVGSVFTIDTSPFDPLICHCI